MRSWLTRGIGKILRQRRLEKNLRLREFANLTSLSVREITRIERGSLDVDLLSLDAVSEVLAVDLSQLLQQVVSEDDERLLCIGTKSVPAAQLEAPFREIIEAEDIDHALVLLDCWRIDCLVIADVEASELNKLRVKLLNRQKFSALPVCIVTDYVSFADFGTMPVHSVNTPSLRLQVDAVLASLSKGKICCLRRSRQQLQVRRENLRVARERLARQNETLLKQVERLRQLRCAKMQAADDRERWESKWRGMYARYEQAKQAHSNLLAQEQVMETRCRFIDKNVAWLMEQSRSADVL